MTGTMLLLAGMMLMLAPQILDVETNIFGIAQSLRRAFQIEPEVPADIMEALSHIDAGVRR